MLPPIDAVSARVLESLLGRMDEKHVVTTTTAKLGETLSMDRAAIERAIRVLRENNFLKPVESGFQLNYTIAFNADFFRSLARQQRRGS